MKATMTNNDPTATFPNDAAFAAYIDHAHDLCNSNLVSAQTQYWSHDMLIEMYCTSVAEHDDTTFDQRIAVAKARYQRGKYGKN
jgi:hypothetical protein